MMTKFCGMLFGVYRAFRNELTLELCPNDNWALWRRVLSAEVVRAPCCRPPPLRDVWVDHFSYPTRTRSRWCLPVPVPDPLRRFLLHVTLGRVTSTISHLAKAIGLLYIYHIRLNGIVRVSYEYGYGWVGSGQVPTRPRRPDCDFECGQVDFSRRLGWKLTSPEVEKNRPVVIRDPHHANEQLSIWVDRVDGISVPVALKKNYSWSKWRLHVLQVPARCDRATSPSHCNWAELQITAMPKLSFFISIMILPVFSPQN